MRGSRVGSSLIAIGSLFFFTNMQMAMAANDGSCVESGPHDGHGGGGCGFLGLGCVADAISTGLGDAAHFVTHDIPWSRIGTDAWAFAKGFAVGLVTAVVAVAVVSALVATFPAWGTAILVTAAVIGVAGLAYTAYNVYKNRNNMSEADWFGLGGN